MAIASWGKAGAACWQQNMRCVQQAADAAHEVVLRLGLAIALERLEEVGEPVVRGGGEGLLGERAAAGRERRLAVLHGEREDRVDRALAHAARRAVDDAHERGLVLRVGEQPDVGEDVADLLAVEEALPADEHVRDALAAQLRLERPGLLLGAVQDGDVAVRRDAGTHAVAQVGDDEVRLLQLVLAGDDLGRRARAERRPQGLAVAARVVRDDAVRGLEDRVRGSVVRLEPDDDGAREVVLEAEDLLDVRAAPAVDALVVVAHDAQVAVSVGDAAHDLVLRPFVSWYSSTMTCR